jgi:hypothetical protein
LAGDSPEKVQIVDPVTGDEMARGYFGQRRRFVVTAVGCMAAAGVKTASGRWVCRIRTFPFHQNWF